MKMYEIISFLCCVLAFAGEAADVKWESVDFMDNMYFYSSSYSTGQGLTLYLESSNIVDVFMRWEWDFNDGGKYHVTFDGTEMSYHRQNIVSAEYGSIACSSTLRNLHEGEYLIHNFIDDGLPPKGSVTIDVDNGSKYYLAFVTEAKVTIESTAVVYGWIAYELWQNSLYILDYAYDLDGGPMIVGGGAYSIPEPSGSVLFLLGGALLALRRRIGGVSGNKSSIGN